MTYLAKESSVEDGQPIELFRFSNVEEKFLFTNGQNEVVFNSETYVPAAVTRSTPDLQNVMAQRTLTVSLPITNPFVDRYVTQVPATIDEFKMFRQHTTDGGTPETATYFSGQVTNVSFQGARAEISILNFGAILDRLVPQQTSRNPCNHILYDSKCGVSDTSFAIDGVVSAISADGLTVTIDSGTNTVPDTGFQLSAQLADDATYFNGGLVARASIELRMARVVTDALGDTATILVVFPFQTLSVGQAIKLFAGCDHQLPTCDAKFANSDRYGGFPFIPLKNPFEIGVS